MSASEFTRVRQDCAETLVALLGDGWIVYPYPKAIAQTNPGVGLVIVNRSKVEPSGSGLRVTTLELHVVEPTTNPDTAEDALETRLDAVLDVLNVTAFEAAFKGAERAMYPVGDSAAHSYVITLEVLTRK